MPAKTAPIKGSVYTEKIHGGGAGTFAPEDPLLLWHVTLRSCVAVSRECKKGDPCRLPEARSIIGEG